MLKKPVYTIALSLILFALSACATNDFPDERRQTLKSAFNLECSSKEECWGKVLATNPTNPKFAIAVPPNMGIEFALLARERFGNKVLITVWDGYFISRSEAINPVFAQAMTLDPFIVTIAPSGPVIEQLMQSGEKAIPVNVGVSVRTSLLERSFTTQTMTTKDQFFSGLARAHQGLAPQIFDWMEREVRKIAKERSRN